ncbi:TetR/AcrR family transcriptional regulator [Paracoccus laeviglucosivorans]|uniref:Transcriptional regulator, TetR family n=1 Tax=Paracoccus laeviglucosivorans TaxID=1197861 RepID=A0A521CSZ3_9RHOB|nr:TetR/AcrR family transcriptional regulator [Paracoccus laeviglucosivorans]SMO62556.1 transcriptional regulator, TetR family [Paracoccus laeviglucosivorans]
MTDDRPYHHGNLVETLLAATVAIIEEKGVEHVSIREAAKRSGVSAGAPFRHFASKTALLTAVAEQAMARLRQAVDTALEQAGDDPLQGFEAIGRGYLNWAIDNPTHFMVISSRTLIDFDSSQTLRRDNAALRALMVELLGRAQADGALRAGQDLDYLVLGARAFVYGLARMAADGHFPEWHDRENPKDAAMRALGLYILQIRA